MSKIPNNMSDCCAHVEEFKRVILNEGRHGASRSKSGENVTLALASTVQPKLNRTIESLDANRNQSFSVSRKSLRVKTSFVDQRMLRMRTDADKMAKHQKLKRMNYEQPVKMLSKIDKKLIDLQTKLVKALRIGADTTVLDALILRCQYYKHTQTVRLVAANEALDARHEKENAILLPSQDVPVFEKPIVPASVGRTYKSGRKVLKDRIVKHGPAEPGKVAIKARSKRKPRKAKPVHKGAGSY